MSRGKVALAAAGAALLGALPALATGCSSTPPRPAAQASPPYPAPASTAPPAEPSPAPSAPPAHVFVVVLENTSYAAALAQPQVARLAGRYGLATDYHAVAHPSLPNYLALAAGDTFGIADDAYHRLPATGLGAQLDAARLPWRAYFEGLNGGCFNSGYPYALKHNPFAYLGAACPGQVVDMARLAGDLALPAEQAPRLSWITPGLCNDGHDCGPAAAARYLDSLVGQVTAAAAWRAGGVLFVTWDEDDGGAANHVPLLVISPSGQASTSARPYDHYSLLATVEDLLALPRLGPAREAAPIDDLVRLPAQ